MSKRPYLTQPIRWLGSKVRARRRILEVIQPIPRRLYVEPFGGSGALFYAKPAEPSVYNDVNSLLVNSLKSCEPAKAATRSGNSQSGRRNAGFSGMSSKRSASRIRVEKRTACAPRSRPQGSQITPRISRCVRVLLLPKLRVRR